MGRLVRGYLPPSAQRVRAVRAAAGLTQEAFAARLGVNGRTVQKWELGEALMPKPTWLLLCELFPVEK